MKTTHYEINGHFATIHDPVKTEEGRQERQKRWKTAAVRYYKAVEKEGVKNAF